MRMQRRSSWHIPWRSENGEDGEGEGREMVMNIRKKMKRVIRMLELGPRNAKDPSSVLASGFVGLMNLFLLDLMM